MDLFTTSPQPEARHVRVTWLDTRQSITYTLDAYKGRFFSCWQDGLAGTLDNVTVEQIA